MNELLQAAKAVIADWDERQVVGNWNLRNAVDRAEKQDVKNASDFIAWASTIKGVNPLDGWVDFVFDAWTAAQQAERERIKDIIKTVGVQCDNGAWVKCETIMEKIHDVC